MMLALPQEIFRPVAIPGFEDCYEVSNYGTLRNTVTGKCLSKRINKKGYTRACLIKDHNRYERHLSIIVGRTFPEVCGEYFDGCEADHINGCRTDDRAVNIRFVSHRENVRNPVTLYRFKRRDLPQCKKRVFKTPKHKGRPVAQLDIEGNLLCVYDSIAAASKSVGCSTTAIGYVVNKHLFDGKYVAKTAAGFRWEFIPRQYTESDFSYLNQD